MGHGHIAVTNYLLLGILRVIQSTYMANIVMKDENMAESNPPSITNSEDNMVERNAPNFTVADDNHSTSATTFDSGSILVLGDSMIKGLQPASCEY